MGGLRITTANITALLGALFGSSMFAHAEAPVVGLKQPISVVGYDCNCDSCNVGILCGGKGRKMASTPIRLCDGNTAAKDGCDTSGCAAAYADLDAWAPCSPSNATAGASCDSVCDQMPMGAPIRSADCRRCKSRSVCTCLNLCRQQGWWIRTEAVMWWSSNDSVPALATSSPLGTPVDDIGVIGLPSTTIVSSDSLFDDMRGGGRVRFGKWANCGLGFDSSGWILGNLTNEQVWQSNGDPGLARPFTNVDPLNPGPDSELVAANGILDGTLTINSSSEIYGGDAGVRKQLYCCSNSCSKYSYRVDCYAGYRHFRIREGLRVTENLRSTALTGPTVLGTTIDLYDDFQTRNEFHGGNLGMVFMGQRGRWSTEIVSKIAIGNMEREVRINGQNTVAVAGFAPVVRPGGLLAQPTNIGVYEDNDFAVLPEFQLNLGYKISKRAKLLVGYTFMYLGEVVRPGDVINTNVNGLQLDPNLPLVGPADPVFAWNDSTMWLMGVTLGAEFNF